WQNCAYCFPMIAETLANSIRQSRLRRCGRENSFQHAVEHLKRMLTDLVGTDAAEYPNALPACALRQLIEQPRLAAAGLRLHYDEGRPSQPQITDLDIKLFQFSRASHEGSFGQRTPAVMKAHHKIRIAVAALQGVIDNSEVRQHRRRRLVAIA